MSLGNTSSISGALLLSQVRRTHVINLRNLDKSEARSESEILIRRFRHRHVSCVPERHIEIYVTSPLNDEPRASTLSLPLNDLQQRSVRPNSSH